MENLNRGQEEELKKLLYFESPAEELNNSDISRKDWNRKVIWLMFKFETSIPE